MAGYFTPNSTKEYVAKLTAHKAVIDVLIAAVKADDLKLVNETIFDAYNRAQETGVDALRKYCKSQRFN